MSRYSKAVNTVIECVIYFDNERDAQSGEDINKEKGTLISMMLKDINKGMKAQPVKKKDRPELNCDSL